MPQGKLGRYLEFVQDTFNFYKRYLEIVWRALMNRLLGEICPFVLSSFVQKGSVADKKDVYTVFCSEAAELCLHILSIYSGRISPNFMQYVLSCYKKTVDFLSKNLLKKPFFGLVNFF